MTRGADWDGMNAAEARSARVTHPSLGDGTVAETSVDGTIALVYWDSGATSAIRTDDLRDVWGDAR